MQEVAFRILEEEHPATATGGFNRVVESDAGLGQVLEINNSSECYIFGEIE